MRNTLGVAYITLPGTESGIVGGSIAPEYIACIYLLFHIVERAVVAVGDDSLRIKYSYNLFIISNIIFVHHSLNQKVSLSRICQNRI